jgi:hypothetical protein
MSAPELELHETLSPALRAEWDAFLAAADRQHPRQDPRFAAVERAEGATPRFAILRRDGRVISVALLSLRPHRLVPGAFAEATALSGPVADDAETLAAMVEALAAHPRLRGRAGRLRVSPYWIGPAAREARALLSARGFRPAEASALRRTGLVPLEGGREARIARLSKSARRELRRAERQGVEIAPAATLPEALECLESLNRLRVSRRLAPLSRAGFEAGFREINGPGEIGVVLAARQEGRLAASLILYRSRDVVHGRHFAPEPERLRALSNLRISPALWLAGMDWAAEKGCRFLDVEDWRADPAPDDPRRAIYKYKAELGPEEIERVGEHYRPLNPALHAPGFAPLRLRRAAGRAWRGLRRG